MLGVSIAALTGDNSTIQQAIKTKEVTENARIEEQRQLAMLHASMNLQSQVYTDKNGNSVTIPAGFAITDIEGENTINDGLVIIDEKGNSFVWINVPKDTKIYLTAGLDITSFTDTEYQKIEQDLLTYTNIYEATYNDEYYTGCGISSETEYTDLKHKMLKGIYTNGGFWIGQFEAGSEIKRTEQGNLTTPTIKSGSYPYTYVTCAQAQNLASQFTNSNYTSSLLFGVQWRLTLKFLEENATAFGTNQWERRQKITNDCSKWGNYMNNDFAVKNVKYAIKEPDSLEAKTWNYANSYTKINQAVLFSTGASKINSVLNIYDLAGNAFERILAKAHSINGIYCTMLGGSYYYTGKECRVNTVLQDGINGLNCNIGFRISLY